MKFMLSNVTVEHKRTIARNVFILVLGNGYSFSTDKIQCAYFTLLQGFHLPANLCLISIAVLFVPGKILVILDSIFLWEIYLTWLCRRCIIF
jgi:hypothetical protein